MSEPVDGQFSNLWQRAKRTAIEYLAVFIAAIAFIFSFVFALIAGWSLLYSSIIDSRLTKAENSVKLWQTYVVELQQTLIEHGVDVPEPPGEQDVESEEKIRN